MYGARVITGLINFVVGLAEFILGLRFVLRLFGANTGADFVTWLLAVSDPLLDPFRGIFPTVVEGRFVIEFTTLFAMIIYALIGSALTWLGSYLAEEATHHPHVHQH